MEKMCYLCKEVPLGPAVYRFISGEERRVHKKCYIRLLQRMQDRYLDEFDETDYFQECLDYLKVLYCDDIDDYTVKRLKALRQSKFLLDSDKRLKYLNENGYNYKKILGLLKDCWNEEEIGWSWQSYEMRANTVFKPMIQALKQIELEENPYKARWLVRDELPK